MIRTASSAATSTHLIGGETIEVLTHHGSHLDVSYLYEGHIHMVAGEHFGTQDEKDPLKITPPLTLPSKIIDNLKDGPDGNSLDWVIRQAPVIESEYVQWQRAVPAKLAFPAAEKGPNLILLDSYYLAEFAKVVAPLNHGRKVQLQLHPGQDANSGLVITVFGVPNFFGVLMPVMLKTDDDLLKRRVANGHPLPSWYA